MAVISSVAYKERSVVFLCSRWLPDVLRKMVFIVFHLEVTLDGFLGECYLENGK